VLEEGPTKPDESVKLAREIELILNDKRRERGFHITSIEGPPEAEEAEDVSEVDEQEAAQLREVNAILRSEDNKEAPTGPEPAVASMGLELSYASSAISLGTKLPSAETTLQPGEAEEEAVDKSRPLRRSQTVKIPTIL